MNILSKLGITKTTDSLPSIVETYLYSCEVEGKTGRTVQAYRETLGQFLEAAHQKKFPRDVKNIDTPCVYRFLGWVKDRGVSVGTQHRRYGETRAFFSRCVRMGHTDHNPFDGVPNVRPDVKVIRPFTSGEVERLLACCNPVTELGTRTITIVMLLLDTGILRAELEGLDVEDIDLNLGRALIRHGKGRRQRVVPFSIDPATAIRNYVDEYRGDSRGRLFLSLDRGHGRRPLNKYHLGTMFQRLGDNAGVHANPHRFRHTFATWAIEAGAREIDVQYLLGNSTAVMTRRYASTYDASMAAVRHKEFSPATIFSLQS